MTSSGQMSLGVLQKATLLLGSRLQASLLSCTFFFFYWIFSSSKAALALAWYRTLSERLGGLWRFGQPGSQCCLQSWMTCLMRDQAGGGVRRMLPGTFFFICSENGTKELD